MNKNPLSYAAKAAYLAGALMAPIGAAKADINSDHQYISQFMSAMQATRGENAGPTRMTIPAKEGYGPIEVTLILTPGKEVATNDKPLMIGIHGQGAEAGTQCFYASPPRMGGFEVIPKSAEKVDCYGRMDKVLESIQGALKQYAGKTGTLIGEDNIERMAQGAAHDGNATLTPQGAELNEKIMQSLVDIIEGKK